MSARRLLAVCPVDHPGGAETGLLRLLHRLDPDAWQIHLTTPGHGPMRDAGMLDDPRRWLNTRFGDDIMLGVQARALGRELVGLVGDDEPFGLRHIGLADSPERLLARGFSFVHSVKNDDTFSEAEIRDFFAARR
jgi:hypothetical protein